VNHVTLSCIITNNPTDGITIFDRNYFDYKSKYEKNMSMISGLVKNLKDLMGKTNNQESSEKHPDQLLKENRTYKMYTPVRYTPSNDSELKLQPVARNR